MNGEKYIEKIKKNRKKYISREELKCLFGLSLDSELYSVIQFLQMQEGILFPTKNSKTNGNMLYPIYDKYVVYLPTMDYEKEIVEIEKLHPLLQGSGYLKKKTEEYIKYRTQLQKLDKYLFSRKGIVMPISRKERSFEIFDEEKMLDDKSFCGLLEKLGIKKDVLHFYDTPEYCFNDYIPVRKPSMRLLICENKDIWFNIRRIMFEDNATLLFEEPIDGVIYGCGNKISGKDALTIYTSFMGGVDVHYLYWGDIDRAGLDIYISLKKCNPTLDIGLFIPGYEKMLQLSLSRQIPDSEDNRVHSNDYSPIISLFRDNHIGYFNQCLEANKRIPQEIISYTVLKNNMR